MMNGTDDSDSDNNTRPSAPLPPCPRTFAADFFAQNLHKRAALLCWCCRVAVASENESAGRQCAQLAKNAGAQDVRVVRTPSGVTCAMFGTKGYIVCAFHCGAAVAHTNGGTRNLVPYKPGLYLANGQDPRVVHTTYNMNARLPESIHGPVHTFPWIQKCVRSVGGWFLDDLCFMHRTLHELNGGNACDVPSIRQRPVVLCGHGDGGAIAQALAMAWSTALLVGNCFTFGSSRVGNKAMTRCVDDAVPGDIYHFTNAADPVPYTPELGCEAQGMRLYIPYLNPHKGRFILQPTKWKRRWDELCARTALLLHKNAVDAQHDLLVYYDRLTRPLTINQQ